MSEPDASLTTVALNLCAHCLTGCTSHPNTHPHRCRAVGCAMFESTTAYEGFARNVVPLVLPNLDLLYELEEYFDDRADVRDGAYGEPAPNRAMQLLSAVRGEIARLANPPPPGPLQVERITK